MYKVLYTEKEMFNVYVFQRSRERVDVRHVISIDTEKRGPFVLYKYSRVSYGGPLRRHPVQEPFPVLERQI